MTTYNLFENAPTLAAADDTGDVSLGTEFIVNTTCWATQFRWYRPDNDVSGATRYAGLYQVTGLNSGTQLIGPFALPTPAANQWGVHTLDTPYELAPGRYKVVVRHPVGRYAAKLGWFGDTDNPTSVVRGPITVPNASDSMNFSQGSFVYSDGSMAYPINQFQSAAYFSDVTISDVNPSTTFSLKTSEAGSWISHNASPKVFAGGLWVPATPKRYESGSWIGL